MLSHLVALCDAKATTTSHAHELSERPPQKWFFASHHKTGTILLDAILEPIKGLFNPKLSYRLYYSHHIHDPVSWSSDVFKYNLIDGQAWARIAHSGHSGIRVEELVVGRRLEARRLTEQALAAVQPAVGREHHEPVADRRVLEHALGERPRHNEAAVLHPEALVRSADGRAATAGAAGVH